MNTALALRSLPNLTYSCAKSIEADIYPSLVTPKHRSQIFRVTSRTWTLGRIRAIKPRTRAVVSAQGVTKDGVERSHHSRSSLRNLSKSSRARQLALNSVDEAFVGVAVVSGMACSATNDGNQRSPKGRDRSMYLFSFSALASQALERPPFSSIVYEEQRSRQQPSYLLIQLSSAEGFSSARKKQKL